MKLIFDTDNLSREEQKKLYLWLKAKFDPDSPSIHTDSNFKDQVILKQNVRFLDLPDRVYRLLIRFQIFTIKDLCNYERSELKEIRNLGDRSFEQIEGALAEFGLSLKSK